MSDSTAKLALGVGAGILIGKLGGSFGWWVLGGATAVFIANSPGTKSALKSGWSSIKK